nr:uncharacterized protein LOC109186235 [Ipomoea batatas]
MTKRTKKAGIVGKYGTRYGASLRKQIKKMEVSQHSKYFCEFCGKYAVKRKAVGIYMGLQGLWQGQSVLRAGVARRIGDGKDTLVEGVPWLADTDDPFVHSPCTDELAHARVCNLLDGTGNWDNELLCDIFEPQDVQRIQKTPISPGYSDAWYWKGDLKGQYSVKHGYNFLVQQYMVPEPGLVFTNWEKLWKLKVPPKVCNFLWRCLRNILPVRDNLRARGVGCCLCSSPSETTYHLFYQCPLASHLWSDTTAANHVESLPQLINHCLCDSDGSMAILMASKLWVIWSVRNDRLWNDKVWQVGEIEQNVRSLVASWQQVYSSPSSLLRNITATPLPGDSLTVWVPPPVGMVKCNVDAALFDDISGLGAVIRDHAGHFVAAYEAMVSAILTTGSKLTLFFHCILGSNFIRCPCFFDYRKTHLCRSNREVPAEEAEYEYRPHKNRLLIG